jgi:hypothetical protein
MERTSRGLRCSRILRKNDEICSILKNTASPHPPFHQIKNQDQNNSDYSTTGYIRKMVKTGVLFPDR